MNRFIIFTRGRTGSTAIVDELDSHPQISCIQEPFIPLAGIPALQKSVEDHGRKFANTFDRQPRFIPFEAWLRQWRCIELFDKPYYLVGMRLRNRMRLIEYYLSMLEAQERRASHDMLHSFGFKLLINHFNNWPELEEVMRARGFKAVYLERKNVVRKVISGQVAQQRGIYNQKKYSPGKELYDLDLEDFEMRVRSELKLVGEEKAMLRSKGFPVLEISYEDFLEERAAFFHRLFDYLEVDHIDPRPTEYSVMITDLRKTVRNYSELVQRVEHLGLGTMLAE